jgi:NADH:ubiquinone reductase (H+-translocating)
VKNNKANPKKLIVLGGGFAGVWAAIGARRLSRFLGADKKLSICLISDNENFGIRPRFYEPNQEAFRVPIRRLLSELEIEFKVESVYDFSPSKNRIITNKGEYVSDGLVLALGSHLIVPSFNNGDKVFSVDSFLESKRFDEFLRSLNQQTFSSTSPLNLIVVGAGFTGLETVMEIPVRLRGLGITDFNIYLLEKNVQIASQFGENARQKILEALSSENIKVKTQTTIRSFDGITAELSSNERVMADGIVWTAGVRAAELTTRVSDSLDSCGRIRVDSFLRAPDVPNIWVAGDVAAAFVDGQNLSAMSCQHAIPQGKLAGYNAAAFLLGQKMKAYQQEVYVTCLDLGAWGALVTLGWGRNRVVAEKEGAKSFKRMINRHLIYPPQGSPEKLLKKAAPQAGGPIMKKLTEVALSTAWTRNIVTYLMTR